MDEINSLVPGAVNFQLLPDKKAREKDPSKAYIKPVTTIDKDNLEHLLGKEYGDALKAAMEEAMQETFDIIGTELVAGATPDNTVFWSHG